MVVSKSANENIYAKVQKQVAKQKLKPGYISPIDFDKLKETNQDIYAWIEIPDTQINYPVVQSGDDDAYYLNHTIDGTERLSRIDLYRKDQCQGFFGF